MLGQGFGGCELEQVLLCSSSHMEHHQEGIEDVPCDAASTLRLLTIAPRNECVRSSGLERVL